MPRCKSCLGEDIKDAIRGLEDPQVTKILDGIPTCDSPTGMQFCGGGKRGGGAKRAPGPYQLHVRECFARRNVHGFSPETMKSCAQEWREMKGK